MTRFSCRMRRRVWMSWCISGPVESGLWPNCSVKLERPFLFRSIQTMKNELKSRTGGQLLVDALKVHGVDTAFCVHTAFQDSTPMILFIGQVGSDFVEREAFQEVDFRRMYGQMAKWVASIDRAERVPEYLSHAFHCAMSGRKGPVVLALPEDMLTQTAVAADTDPYQEVVAHPGAGDLAALRVMLAEAQRPLAIPGGSGWNAHNC